MDGTSGMTAPVAGRPGHGPGRASVHLAQLVRDGQARRAGALAFLAVASPLAGLVVAVPVVAGVIDHLSSGVGSSWVLVAIAALGALSILVTAAISGTLWATRAIRRPDVMRSGSVLAMSAVTVAVGSHILASAIVALWSLAPDGPPVWAGLVIGILGIPVAGLPALLIVVPHVVVWRALMRRVAAAT